MAEHLLRRYGHWQRLRWNIIGICICCIAPYIFIMILNGDPKDINIFNLTLGGSLLAALVGVYQLRSLSNYPGVQGSTHIIPAFITGFGVIFFAFLFGRLVYSRSVFIISFLLCTTWFYLAYFRAQRRGDVTIGLIPLGAAPNLATIDRIKWQVLPDPSSDATNLSAIAVDLRSDLPDEWERKLTDYALDGLPVYHSKRLWESLTGQVELEHLSENGFGSLAPISAYMTMKHLVDWLAAALVIIGLSPVLIAIIAMIKIDSAGPAIFKQRRIGRWGHSFTVYKFRSMTVKEVDDSDSRLHAMTQSNDQRVTRVGRFLRKSRLDEFPQIINILKGEMSWIGPRPEAEVLSRWYENEIPFYRYRHIVRPGISGWAQVSQGHVSEVEDVRRKLHYDFYYIKNFSPWLDMLIVARTLRTMTTGFGAR